MALPRRPYLLGLLPGTSNDWATREEERQRDRESERDHEDRGQKEEKLEDKRVGRENMVNIDKYKCDFMQ